MDYFIYITPFIHKYIYKKNYSIYILKKYSIYYISINDLKNYSF